MSLANFCLLFYILDILFFDEISWFLDASLTGRIDFSSSSSILIVFLTATPDILVCYGTLYYL